jgi:hypothetical protein
VVRIFRGSQTFVNNVPSPLLLQWKKKKIRAGFDMSDRTIPFSVTSQYLLNCVHYRFCRLCIINLWRGKKENEVPVLLYTHAITMIDYVNCLPLLAEICICLRLGIWRWIEIQILVKSRVNYDKRNVVPFVAIYYMYRTVLVATFHIHLLP